MKINITIVCKGARAAKGEGLKILWHLYARVPERPKGKDLRSFGIGLRGFESLPLHYFINF